jgi:flavodoxin
MNSVVIYGSHFGNTRQVAEAIAAELGKAGPVQLFAADDAPRELPAGTDLLVVGGPIEAFHMTKPVSHLLHELAPETVDGVHFAAFETRVQPHWYLLGSTAKGISKGLDKLGGAPIAPPESFLVQGQIDQAQGKVPHLVEGELEHATRWAASLLEALGEPVPA